MVAAFDRAGVGVGDRVLTLLDAPSVVAGRGLATALVNEIEDLPDDVAPDPRRVPRHRVVCDLRQRDLLAEPSPATASPRDLQPERSSVTSGKPSSPLGASPSYAPSTSGSHPRSRRRSCGSYGASISLRTPSHALEDKTEGWAVGLQLAALSLRGRTDPDKDQYEQKDSQALSPLINARMTAAASELRRVRRRTFLIRHRSAVSMSRSTAAREKSVTGTRFAAPMPCYVRGR